MWTYLAILLSGIMLVGVFVRRAIIFYKGKNDEAGPSEKISEEQVEDQAKKLKKRLSRKDREKVEDLCQKAEKKIKVGREDEAIKYFVQALAIDELHIETQHKLAMLYMQKQMFSAAAALFKNLGNLTNDAVHYSHLGLALYQQKLFEEAKDAYQKAVDLDPSRPQRFASLAQVYRALKQFQNAVIALNKAIELDSENLNFLFLLTDIQIELGNFYDAEEIVKGIIEIDPENEDAKEYLKYIRKNIKQESPSE